MITRRKAQETLQKQFFEAAQKLTDESESENAAALNDQSDPVKDINRFIKDGVNINARNQKGQTVLHVLVQNYLDISRNQLSTSFEEKKKLCHAEILKTIDMLINSKIDINGVDSKGRSALHLIGRNLRKICPPRGMYSDAMYQILPKQPGIIELVKVLVEGGADVLLVDADGLTPLHEVFCIGKVNGAGEICDYLEGIKEIPIQIQIELKELSGAAEVVQDVRYQESYLPKLRSAMKMRERAGLLYKRETVMNDFLIITESNCEEDVIINFIDEEEAIKEAIVIFARILGANHKEVLAGLSSFLDYLEENRYMGVVFDLEVPTALKYNELTVQHWGESSIYAMESASKMTRTVSLLNYTEVPVIIDSLKVLLKSIGLVQENRDVKPYYLDYEEAFYASIYAIYIILHRDVNAPYAVTAIKDFSSLYKAWPKKRCDSILDIILNGLIEVPDGYDNVSLISLEKLIKELSKYDQIDLSKSARFLHSILEFLPPENLITSHDGHLKEFIEYLLARGLHIDENGQEGGMPLFHVLKKYGLDYSGVEYRSLQCLAADKVANSLIKDGFWTVYEKIVPQHLQEFVYKHHYF